MKKCFLFMCVVLLAFSSCSNEINDEGFVDKTKALSFSAYPVKSRTVLGDITTTNMTGDNFGVVGYSDNMLYLGATGKATEQHHDGSNWDYVLGSELRFWPFGDMDFYAYFPYSANATFTDTNDEGTVMTIPSVNANSGQEILFACKKDQGYIARVPLTFYHVFSKIEAINIQIAGGDVAKGDVKVEVSNVELINTSTEGTVNVDADGIATYANPTVSRTFSLVSPVVLDKTSASALTGIVTSADNGYLFATGGLKNNVTGTGKTLWNGSRPTTTGKISEEGEVCLKLTCKVWTNGTNTYYVGYRNNYGEMYIPLTGSSSGTPELASLDAGKKYTFNIVMKDNVGFRDNGEAVLKPIRFEVNQVVAWETVTVTITL